jgi:hypothetical protein
MGTLGLTTIRTTRTTRPPLGEHEWRLADLARAVDMPQITLYTWVARGWVHAHRHPDAPRRWVVHADPAEVERLRALHQVPRGQHLRRSWLANQQTTLDLQ